MIQGRGQALHATGLDLLHWFPEHRQVQALSTRRCGPPTLPIKDMLKIFNFEIVAKKIMYKQNVPWHQKFSQLVFDQ